jgi:hypothetical protein
MNVKRSYKIYPEKEVKEETVDYEINNYTFEEIQTFFKLNNYDNYGIEEINKEYEYLNSKSPNDSFDIFILKAKELLVNDYYKRKIDNYKIEQQSLDIELQKYKQEQTSLLVPDILPNINGAEYNYICKKLVINSKFRKDFLNTQSNNFTIQLPYLFRNVISIEFKAMEYCNSIYSITSKLGNNNFNIDGVNYVIPDGNYSNEELINYINTILPSNIDICYNINTGKTIISSSTSTNFDISFGIDSIYENIDCPPKDKIHPRLCPDTEKLVKSYNMYDTLGYILGFRNFNYSSSSSYTSESILDVKGFKYIYLYLDDFINSSSYDTIITINSNDGDYFSSKILARLANTETSYHIKYQDSSDTIDRKRYYYGPVNIQKLHIQLLNDKGELIDNNNTDFSIMLELKMMNK